MNRGAGFVIGWKGGFLKSGVRKALKSAARGPGGRGAWAAAATPAPAPTAPPVESLREYKPPQASLVLDREGKLLARLAPEERIVIPLSAMSPRLVSAFIAVEDQRFFEHHGIDWRRVAGALWRDPRTASLREGSSTITMQLARHGLPGNLT